MELIVINENKLKIMMTKNDMESYGLNENEFYCSVSNAREILEKILHNSPIHTGFENITIEDKILIQLYPDKNGGCELYVTKMIFDETEYTRFMPEENNSKYLLPKPQIKMPLISFKFDTLEDVILAAKELVLRNHVYDASFYKNHDGKYYLFINTSNGNGDSPIEFLSEFGEMTNTENSYLMLLEYGKCLYKKDAIKVLSVI